MPTNLASFFMLACVESILLVQDYPHPLSRLQPTSSFVAGIKATYPPLKVEVRLVQIPITVAPEQVINIRFLASSLRRSIIMKICRLGSAVAKREPKKKKTRMNGRRLEAASEPKGAKETYDRCPDACDLDFGAARAH
ncbi:hypothetical protein IF2G_09537 [Cordyceps javanica]|nr:hypothetical protein IF2G_09537 [Cordyceps javanica]